VVVAHHVPVAHVIIAERELFDVSLFKALISTPAASRKYSRPAEHVQQTTLPLPDTLSDDEASFTEPLACCVRAVRRISFMDGDSIAIIGLGSIGLLMAQAVKALEDGRQTVYTFGVDVLAERLALARELGIDQVHSLYR